MPQPYDESDLDDRYDDDSNDSQVTLSRGQIRAMERDAKEARTLREQNAQQARELAFARAGGDFTERQQKAVLATLDGDVTADSIRAAAEELGFLAPSTPADDTAAGDRIAAASNGSPSETSDDDPVARLYRADREGGKDAVLAEIARSGRHIVTSG